MGKFSSDNFPIFVGVCAKSAEGQILLDFCNGYAILSSMNKSVANWIKSSEYDIRTAKVMEEGGRHIYVVFMCHLAVEKSLKAIVTKRTRKIPPKTHDLYYLIKLADLEVPFTYQKIISHLNQASIPTRYPEDIAKISRQYNKSVALKYLKETQGLLRWLKKIK